MVYAIISALRYILLDFKIHVKLYKIKMLEVSVAQYDIEMNICENLWNFISQIVVHQRYQIPPW